MFKEQEKETMQKSVNRFSEEGLIGHRTIEVLNESIKGNPLPDPPDYYSEKPLPSPNL